MMNFTHTTKSRRGIPRLALASALALSIGGCDTNKLVEVEDPAALRPDQLETAAAVPFLINGALRQFQGGYSGFGDDSFLAASALISDETFWGDTFPTRFAVDNRTLQPTVLGNMTNNSFTRLMQGRRNARRAFGVIEQFTPEDVDNKALMRTVEGYVYVTISEGWCGSVPFSDLPDTGPLDPNEIEDGVSLSTAEMNDAAIALFDEALGFNSADNLAMMGKARALLNNGDFAGAAAAVATVPTTFVFHLEHSTNTGAENNPQSSLQQNGRYFVSNLEGGLNAAGGAIRPDDATHPVTAPGGSAEGLNFRAARDPRVPWQQRPTNNGNCFTASFDCWWNLNYLTLEADVPIASGVEARLIEAEAALRAGDPVTMMARLNTLRASAATLIPGLYPDQEQVFAFTLDPLIDPGIGLLTPAEMFEARRALLFRERALWLYNTGHRQGDLRRLVRDYGFTSSQVFPSGPYARGGSYGNDVSFPVPFTEQNNELFDPATCVLTIS